MSDREPLETPAKRAARGWYVNTAWATGILGVFLVVSDEIGWGAWLLLLSGFCTAMWLYLRRKDRITNQ